MSYRVIEAETGAQVLPPLRGVRNLVDQRATMSSWSGHLAMDADLRNISKATREVAERLIIVRVTA